MSPNLDNGVSAELGQLIIHDEQEWFVVRVVDSTALFQTSEEVYILTEKYAELRHRITGEVGFKTFSQVKSTCEAINGERRGLDPKIWRKF